MPVLFLLCIVLFAVPSAAADALPDPPLVIDEPAAPPSGLDDILTESLAMPAMTAPRAKPTPATTSATHPVAVPSDATPPQSPALADPEAQPTVHHKTGIEAADLPPVTPEVPDITIAAPIPDEAIDKDHPLTKTVTGIAQDTKASSAIAPDISSAPVIMRGPTNLSPPPVPSALTRYQFLPLMAKGAAPDALPMLWPVLSSRPLSGNHSLVNRVVIVVHDTSRDAAETLREMVTIAGPGASGARANTLIIAPLFAAKHDRAFFKPLLTDATAHVAAWDAEGWWQGADTTAADNKQRSVSSMTALDMLLLILADTKLYPELRSVILAGYGRGGDFVHRYALFGRAPDILAQQHLPLHYVVADAQSYVYLTDARPSKAVGSFAPLKDTKTCPTYQDYPYGLETPNNYTRLTAGNVARLNYSERQVTYLVGGGGAGQAVDQNCGAVMQGKSVKDRAINYDAYLKSSFGDMPKQKLLIMPGTGDDALALLASGCGASLLFSDGECLRAEDGRR
ncbi:MAG: hypothetical protein KBA75_03245 [Alphaproteobacteria bacterium]|nr:hypothetical protein [Alphaproteobacteria bacterium]